MCRVSARAMLELSAKPTSSSVRQLIRRSLKERKRMVLTMKKESTSTTISTGTGEPERPPETAWLAATSETRMPAAPGIGRPRMYLSAFLGEPSEVIDSTLKRASRIAPHATNAKHETTATVPSGASAQL